MRTWTLKVWLVFACAVVLSGSATRAQRAASSPVAPAGTDIERLQAIDALVNQAITEHKLPGAVVLVGRGDTIVYRKAYGNRAVTPQREAMTLDTIFDLASLTKVVSTTTAVMMLVETGQVRLNDTVASFIPEFGKYGKERLTVRDLLTHSSGLRPDLDLGVKWRA